MSAIGTSFFAGIFALYSMKYGLYSEYALTPVICLPAVNFFASLGIQSMTFTVITEIFPERIKAVGVSFFVAFYWTLSFVFMRCAFYMTVSFSVVVCSVGTIIIKFIMPETRCKSRQEIMKLL